MKLILVSGDLAYSGKKSECFQVLHFFNSIKAAIKSRYGILDRPGSLTYLSAEICAD